jgi:hypothetical protein
VVQARLMVLKKQFNGFHKMLKIDLDNISQYSNLPSILNDKTLKVKYKNHQSNIREFEMDKWKSLLSLCESSDTKIGDLSAFCAMKDSESSLNPSLKPFLYDGSIYVDSPFSISNKFIEHSIDMLKNTYTKNECSSLVEVGAGYGRLLLPLIEAIENYKIEKVLGLDLTESSGLILSNLSNRLSYNIET